jgi:hypothetical protein
MLDKKNCMHFCLHFGSNSLNIFHSEKYFEWIQQEEVGQIISALVS